MRAFARSRRIVAPRLSHCRTATLALSPALSEFSHWERENSRRAMQNLENRVARKRRQRATTRESRGDNALAAKRYTRSRKDASRRRQVEKSRTRSENTRAVVRKNHSPPTANFIPEASNVSTGVIFPHSTSGPTLPASAMISWFDSSSVKSRGLNCRSK